jgi:hypothetical protein
MSLQSWTYSFVGLGRCKTKLAREVRVKQVQGTMSKAHPTIPVSRSCRVTSFQDHCERTFQHVPFSCVKSDMHEQNIKVCCKSLGGTHRVIEVHACTMYYLYEYLCMYVSV